MAENSYRQFVADLAADATRPKSELREEIIAYVQHAYAAGEPWAADLAARRAGFTPAQVAAIELGDDYSEFVAYLRATGQITQITTMRRLDTAMHRFRLSRATAAALARLDAEIGLENEGEH